MKATGAGKILGYALESYDGGSTSTDKILVFISLDERGSGDLTVQQNGNGQIEVQTFVDNVLTTIFSIDEEGAMVVDRLKAQEIETGKLQTMSGITIYDRATGQPHCVYMENGELKTVAGKCVFNSTSAEPASTGQSSSSQSTEGVCQNGTNRPCSTDVGACQIGVEICEQGVWGECIGAVMPSEEICDGLDNDCDDLIDEDLIQQCGLSDVGVCQFGTQTCSAGVWGECQGAIEPSEEVCDDSIDNNCDGLIDEECQITESSTSTDGTATSTDQ